MWIVHRRTVGGLCAVVLCGVMAPTALVSTALAAEAQVPPAAQALMTQFPGVQAHMEGSRVLALYGKPMTAGTTPAEAAQRWLEDHASAFGVGALDVQLLYTHELSFGRFTVFGYEQQMDGLPVEQGRIKLLVLNGSPDQVVYAGARLAVAPEGGFGADVVDAAAALASVQNMEQYAGLTEWSVPTQVIYYGEGDGALRAPIRAWKFAGSNTDRANPEAYTFFVDAATGDLVYARDEVYYVDVDGHVSGMASPGTFPDMASNPETEMDLQDLRVRISGGSTSYTDPNGNYVIPHSGGGSVTVIADILGRWVDVNNTAGADLQLSQSVTPPGPADFLFNTSLDEFTTSQVNGFIHTTSTHNFFKDRQPGFTGLDMVLPCYVNLNQTCNAYFTPLSINFFMAGGGCNNTAYSSVVAHEYGHFVVHRLVLAQGAFGEGYGDTTSILQYDDGIVGRWFTTSGGYVRNIPAANKQYPCSGPSHDCGQLLAGCWWDIKLNLQASLGSSAGLELARQLFVDWSMITDGGIGDNSAHPGTAIEVLTVDDDDGDLSNGTPHNTELCDGFAAHSIVCVVPGDCNANGIPDSCDIDCGAPGGPCDVPGCGGSADCNTNGIPDECEDDCNGNGIPDECDIADCDPNDPACQDCNGNGIPDECDLGGGGVCEPDDYSDATDISTACSGVLLSVVSTGGPVYAVFSSYTSTGTNVFGPSSGGSPTWDTAGMRIDLAGRPTSLAIDVVSDDPSDYGTLSAYDNTGALCDEDSAGPLGTGQWETLTVTCPSGISHAIARSTQCCALFDHLAIPGGDCNANAIPDDCDIADCDPNDLACQDCNTNGIPDECDIADCDPNDPACQDCNGNGIPDECDIADCDPNDPACQDCNTNGIPDECDIADCDPNDPACQDCNGNGIPDECDLGGGGVCEPDDYSDGTDISIACSGVMLSVVSTGGPVYAVFSSYTSTGTNVFGPSSGGSPTWDTAGMRIDLAGRPTSLAIDVVSDDPSDYGTLSAYDNTGALCDQDSAGPLGTGQWETLTVTCPSGIAYAIARSTQCCALFDHLVVPGAGGDCNGNGRPDDCDIADCDPNDLACQDCNTNGIPDECDIADCDPNDPACHDCNGNGIPDECDIADCDPNDPACHDCNGNNIPDECDLAAPGDGGLKSVAMFFDDLFVDVSREADLLRDALVSRGHTITTFTGTSGAAWCGALGGADVLVVPELDGPDLYSALEPAARLCVQDFVDNGGRYVQTYATGPEDLELLNHLFGTSFSTFDTYGGPLPLDPSAAAGTVFEGGPGTLPSSNDTNSMRVNELPVGARAIYTNGTQTTLATWSFGMGQITWLGFDYWQWPPTPPAWVDVADRAVRHVTINLDCNGNNIPDECDIRDCPPGDPACADCNHNDVPDECDIADCDPNDPACQDCNSNGIPDECDIADCDPNDPACQDCNGNDIPDECDIADCDPNDLACQDCNTNGIPDECDITTPGSGVAMFFDDVFVDVAREAALLKDALVSRGHIVTTFTGTSGAAWCAALGNAHVLVVPELDGPDLYSALEPAARLCIQDFVSNSGGYVQTYATGLEDLELLNHLFGTSFSTFDTYGGPLPLDPNAAAGTPFEGGPNSLPFADDTNSMRVNELPAGARAIYTNGTQTTLATWSFGMGQITWLGFDYWRSPTPSAWVEVVDRAVPQVTVNLDCNGNGVPDDCDIADCDPNDPACQDCNSNDIPDECDIADGTSSDDNGNGVPDECEALVGDFDGDGDVDLDDLIMLLARRGEPADGPDDPYDLDGDGWITALDARILVTLCTRPGCATEDGDGAQGGSGNPPGQAQQVPQSDGAVAQPRQEAVNQ